MARFLVVADRTATSPELVERVRQLVTEDPEPTSVTLLIPARSPSPQWAGEAKAAARRTGDRATALFEAAGAKTVSAVVGDVSPLLAIEDELAEHPGEYQAVVLSTLPPGISRWLRLDVHHQAERRLDVPVFHVVAHSTVAIPPRSGTQ